MAKHQIIYTSCMRGIDGVNDGQQIFSYDESFQGSKADEVKSLFTYQVPSLPPGVIMTEEIAATMPSSFMYRALKSGGVSLTLNTYLGRDYMGSAGRFGNHLSHSIVCDFCDFNVYPCEMYASTALRSSMEYEEVNNPEVPAYLPTPELIKGYTIDPETIVEFLGIADNLEYYKKMVAAMLKFPEEKKRVVICDEPENIAKWIAALHYVLPLDIAKRVNFTTYEYDPELSPSQICGVIPEGSRYNVSNYVFSNHHFVFDFKNNQFNEVESDSLFIDFVDTAFSFSYESLLAFHDFVISKTTYRDCDEKYYAAYYLYNLFADGISDITREQFEAIASFADEFLTEDVKRELAEKLLEEKPVINQMDNEYALFTLGYMLKLLKLMDVSQQQAVKQMIVDRLIYTISSDGMEESAFLVLYDNIDAMARTVKLSLPVELMVESNRRSLLSVLAQSSEVWKVRFIIRIISDYVKDMAVSVDELYPDRAIGAIYSGIVQAVYKTSRQTGFGIVETLLDGFREHASYYVNMTFNVEGYLKDLNMDDSEIGRLWSYFGDAVMNMEENDFKTVYLCLDEYKRYDEMYMLFDRKIRTVSSFNEVRDYFTEYWNKWVKSTGYGRTCAPRVLKRYYQIYDNKLSSIPSKEAFSYACEILDIAMRMEVADDFVDDLCQAVCEFIPLAKVNTENRKLLKDMYRYQREVLRRNIGGRLLLFLIAIELNKIANKSTIGMTVQKILEVSDPEGASFSGLDERKIEDYFEWAFGAIDKYSLREEDYSDLYQLFRFTNSTQSVFMLYWCKVSYKNSKGDKDYEDFGEFLSFMFHEGSLDDRDEVGKYLGKLSKQKLEDLDDEMTTFFKRDRKSAHAWEDVRHTASKTNPLLNNLSNLFKRK